MKFNWGHGIALFYIFFMAVMIFFVAKSTTYDNSLVVDNYYEKDLAYQSHYEKLANAKGLKNEVSIKYDLDSGDIRFHFPKAKGIVAGTVYFYRPSDKTKDFEIKINLDQNFEQSIPAADLNSGLWKLKVDWQVDGKLYYKEETVIL